MHAHYTQRERAKASHAPTRTALSPADRLLPLLDGVRQTGPGRWMAICPAHEDRSPSLSARETEDGRLLIHDFGGCGPDAIVAAVGLDLADLFPARPDHGPDWTGRRPAPPRHRADELIRLAALEALIVAIAAGDLLAGRDLSGSDRARMALAVETLTAVAEEVAHGR